MINGYLCMLPIVRIALPEPSVTCCRFLW